MSEYHLTIEEEVLEVVHVGDQGPAGPKGDPGEGVASASDLPMDRVAGSTYSNVQHMQDIFHSSGWTSGGDITDNGDGTVSVAVGTGLIRNAASAVAPLLFFDWAAAGPFTVPSGEERWIGVEWNAGAPQVVSRTVNSFNGLDEFGIGNAAYDGTKMHVQKVPRAVGDHAGQMIDRLLQVNGPQRDNLTGGLTLAETGTRNLTVSAGAVWHCLARFAVAAINTATGSTFDAYTQDGGAAESLNQTQWDNQNYSASGVLTPLTANRYGTLWWYIDIDEGRLVCIYGSGNHATLAAAEDESPPTVLPLAVKSQRGILIARTIFQKGGSTFTDISTPFETAFSLGSVSTHNNLAGLNSGDFQHLTTTQLAFLAGLVSGGAAAELKGATETAAATHDATEGAGYTVNATTNDHTVLCDGTPFTLTKGSGWEGTSKKNRVSIHFVLTGADGVLPNITLSGWTWWKEPPDFSGMTPDTGGLVLELYETSYGTVQGTWSVK